jgi:hypothetical protein
MVVCGGLLTASPASAQTLIPPSLVGGQGPTHQTTKQAQPQCATGVTLLCAAQGLVSGAVGAAGGAAKTVVGGAADAVLGGLVGWAADGAAWLLKTIGTEIDHSTRPALGSAWFARRYAAMRELAIALSLVFVLAAIIQAAVRQDLALLARSVLVGLPLGILLTFAAVTLTELALAVTDAMTTTALGGAGDDARAGFADLAKVLLPTAVTGPAIPGLVLFLGAILTSVLALVVWIELVLREAAVYVALAFLPIALAGVAWPRTTQWARRLAEWLGAVILAKFTIAVSFAIAAAMLGNARSGSGGLSALLGGCAVLLIAALSPWVLLRLVPFAEQAAGSLHRAHVGAAVATIPGAAATGILVRQAMVKSFGASAAIQTAEHPPGSDWEPPRAEQTAQEKAAQ